jgi:hypothetical protein
MDLVRKILLSLNEANHGFAPNDLGIENFSEEQIGYHCLLLNEAGLIQASEITTLASSSPIAIPIRLTWEGHEFVENAQNEAVWRQTKETVGKLGDVSFSVWATVLSQVVMRNLGLTS